MERKPLVIETEGISIGITRQQAKQIYEELTKLAKQYNLVIWWRPRKECSGEATKTNLQNM